MDPSPKSHPILSFVMSRLPSLKSQTQNHDEYDIEQPRISPRAPDPFPQIELVDRFPHLSDPVLLAAMKSAVADVAQTRSILRALGPRPDHEAVDLAKSRIAQIQHEAQSEDMKSELVGLKAIVQLDEMHESYENLLKDAETRLVKIYEGHNSGSKLEAVNEEEEMVSEEVMTILRDAEEKSLDKVMLAGKGLRFLPEGFGRIRGLIVLDLSNNQLETIPDSIAGLEHLQELRAASNLLASLPDSIGFLLSLKILDVSGNKLKALPDSISNCRSLVELDASYNALAYLPTNIGHNLVKLEKLYIQLNKLRSLPSSICEMRSLRILDAHFNELHGLPYAMGKLSSLEVLNLSSNFTDLQELPPSLCDCFNLTELDLSNNQIHALPDTFGRLEKLVKLNLDQNPLQMPPMDIVNLGVDAVREYMSKRRLDMLLEEEQRNQQAETPSKAAWLTRSVSSLVTGVSEYLSGTKSPRDPYLDQEL